MSIDWEKVNERLPYRKGEEGEHLLSIFVPQYIFVWPHSGTSAEGFRKHYGTTMCHWESIPTIPAKQRRKEMWGAIDVNDNGYASLSEITRVSEWMPFVVEEIPKNTDILALKIYSNVLAKQPGYLNSGNLFDMLWWAGCPRRDWLWRPLWLAASHQPGIPPLQKTRQGPINIIIVTIIVVIMDADTSDLFSTSKYLEWSGARGRLSRIQGVSHFPPHPPTVLWIPPGFQKVWKLISKCINEHCFAQVGHWRGSKDLQRRVHRWLSQGNNRNGQSFSFLEITLR